MQGIRRIRYLPEGEIRLSAENRAAFRSPESIEEAARRGTILESTFPAQRPDLFRRGSERAGR